MTPGVRTTKPPGAVNGFVPVPEAADLRPGKGMTVLLGDRRVALFNLDGRFHALEDECPHVGAPLGSGWVDGHTVACPMHGWEFDIRSGACQTVPRCPVKSFPVRLRDGLIEISLDANPEGSDSISAATTPQSPQ